MYQAWNLSNLDHGNVNALEKALGIKHLTASLLVSRGLSNPDDADEFLNPQLTSLIDPFKLKDMDKAIARIKDAILENQQVTIYGDYDADGVSATTILMRLFKEIGQKVNYYIPNRLKGGYGLSTDTVSEIANDGTKLLITVDCGINSIEEVTLARDLGMDVIITDHHEVGNELPPAVAIINPKRPDCEYPFKELAGVGVAFKLAWALAKELSQGDKVSTKYREFLKNMLGIVALGTITDVVPLLEENRILAKWGLDAMTSAGNAGLHALIESCGLRDRKLTSHEVAFKMGPRLNAAGRLGDASLCVELLITESFEQALNIAAELEIKNKERQAMGNKTLEEARNFITSNNEFDSEMGVVLAKEGWHQGVIGIVASRLVEEFHRPTVLISVENGEGRGSGRSVPDFNIYTLLQECSHLLTSFGGHNCAAGLAIKEENIEEFQATFNKLAAQRISRKDLTNILNIDASTDLDQLTHAQMIELMKLEPFGHSNSEPIFEVKGIQIGGRPKVIGSKGQHISFYAKQNNVSFRAVGFGHADKFNMLNGNDYYDIAFTPVLKSWRGNEKVELHFSDIKKST